MITRANTGHVPPRAIPEPAPACPPCNHNCSQGRSCKAKQSHLPPPLADWPAPERRATWRQRLRDIASSIMIITAASCTIIVIGQALGYAAHKLGW